MHRRVHYWKKLKIVICSVRWMEQSRDRQLEIKLSENAFHSEQVMIILFFEKHKFHCETTYIQKLISRLRKFRFKLCENQIVLHEIIHESLLLSFIIKSVCVRNSNIKITLQSIHTFSYFVYQIPNLSISSVLFLFL